MPKVRQFGGPDHWTQEDLTAVWYDHLNLAYEKKLRASGIEDDATLEAVRQADTEAPKRDNLVVKQELTGLWSLPGGEWVVEGECPVSPVAGGLWC
jgi:hypothetical protein